MKRVVGIDPGASGALVLLSPEARVLAVEDMPTFSVKVGRANKTRVSAAQLAGALRHWDAEHGVDLIVCEEVHAMPGQGVSSMFAFGEALGVVKGVCAALGLPLHMVAPQEWQKATRTRGGKDGARARASELWPGSAHYFKRVKDDGRADAALIACYGQQTIRPGSRSDSLGDLL